MLLTQEAYSLTFHRPYTVACYRQSFNKLLIAMSSSSNAAGHRYKDWESIYAIKYAKFSG